MTRELGKKYVYLSKQSDKLQKTSQLNGNLGRKMEISSLTLRFGVESLGFASNLDNLDPKRLSLAGVILSEPNL
jgi:hypothetical protein